MRSGEVAVLLSLSRTAAVEPGFTLDVDHVAQPLSPANIRSVVTDSMNLLFARPHVLSVARVPRRPESVASPLASAAVVTPSGGLERRLSVARLKSTSHAHLAHIRLNTTGSLGELASTGIPLSYCRAEDYNGRVVATRPD